MYVRMYTHSHQDQTIVQKNRKEKQEYFSITQVAHIQTNSLWYMRFMAMKMKNSQNSVLN